MRSSAFIKFILVLTGIYLLNATGLHSQVIDEFPTDSAKFVETYKEYMEGKISEENKSILQNFIQHWETGKFKPYVRDSIIFIANQLLVTNGKREPHFTKMMSFFIKTDSVLFEDKYFIPFMKSVRYTATWSKRRLSGLINLMEFTNEFLENSGLHVSRTRSWYALSQDHKFIFDTTLKVIYTNTDIKCKFRDDSIHIYNTSGTYYPFRVHWTGKNGIVTWERAGYSKDNIYAELNSYSINMTKAQYKADSVKFINKLYFEEPVLGKLEEKLIHISNPSGAIYPVFRSYQNLFEIDNIYENMDFTGGFTMKGSQFIGSGSEKQEAVIHVRNNDKLFMTVKAQVFILQKAKAVSRNASVTIHLENDSIYHTGLQFNYLVNSQEIELTTNDNVLSESVSYNSYHNVSMKF